MKVSKVFACALLTTASFLAACGGGGTDVVSAPPAPFVPEARYGAAPLQDVTLFEPTSPAKGLVVWVHGGGWVGGDKAEDLPYFEGLTAKGIAVLNVNYRLGPDGAFPKSVEDIKTVLAALDGLPCPGCTNAELWDRARSYSAQGGTMVAGASAGGHLALYASAEALRLNPSSRLKCIVGQVPLVDFRELSAYPPEFVKGYIAVFAGGDLSREHLERISPAVQVEQGAWQVALSRKWFLFYSSEDVFVPSSTTKALTASLRAQGTALDQVDHVSTDMVGGHNVTIPTLNKHLKDSAASCFGNL